ncbi:response regulator transcription factor [Aurantimicrobium sp. INA4]|uniref:response regulator transcription factor n=1 Tax=Aurantimicrobium sp. INA4 TaxID=2986279 RepID=UPI002490C8B8|nr:response regulator transcription factor [Aurantimicrobium sp. INA4]
MNSIRVAVVEDQQLFRELLTTYLDSVDDIEVVVSAGTVEAARAMIHENEVDVAILDIDLPDGNGIGLGVSLRRDQPHIGILLLSEKDLLELVRTLPKDTQRGWSYLAKSSSTDLEVLTSTIRSTARGYSVIDPKLALRVDAREGTGVAALSARQFEVLRLLATGKSTEAIAAEMELAPNSVVNMLTAIYSTLKVPEDANPRVYAVLQFLSDTAREIN